MLSIYSNQQELVRSTAPVKIQRLNTIDQDLLTTKTFAVTFKETSRPKLEFHVYTPDGVYLTGNHDIDYAINSNDNTSNLVSYQYIAVDTNKTLESLGFTRGQYRITYNLFDNVLGSFVDNKCFIKEISPSRRELRIQLANNGDVVQLQQLRDLRDAWLQKTDVSTVYLLNFGFNETYQIINFRFDIDLTDTPEIFVKLYNPLPSKYGEKVKCWISTEVIEPTIELVSVVPTVVAESVTNIAGPNFDLDEYDSTSIATDFKSWNDLLNANLQTSQQLIDNYFSGSLSGIKLNTSFRIFDNFVHYSSAVERVKNFKYKLEIIEHYTSQIQNLNNVVGGVQVQTNLLDLYTKRNQIVSGFDDFEKYLFFESTGSQLYTHCDETIDSILSGSVQSAIIQPWPKISPVNLVWSTAYAVWSTAASQWFQTLTSSPTAFPDPYNYFQIQEPTTSSIAETYYADLLEKAELYDKYNIHKLQNAIPMHIQNSEYNDELILFVNMLGQHFDILWLYIKALTDINSREEHPKDGMSNDLLYHVASSLGFNLLNGKSKSDLWKYALGLDDQGISIQPSGSITPSIPDESNTKELWRRIVNNLPYILKTKGTSRSIKALLSCFGIPSTILTIKEYGGPSTFTENDHFPEYVHDVFHYAWYSNSTGSISIPGQSYNNGIVNNYKPDVLEFRFKTDNNYSYNLGTEYVILSSSNSALTLQRESADDNQATIKYRIGNFSASLSNLEILDNSWQHVVITRLTNNSASIHIAKPLYGNVVYLQSASFYRGFGLFTLDDNIYFASGSNKLYGHFHEIRLWSGSLNDETIKEHAISPNTYTYNVNRSLLTTGQEADKPYYHLLQRFTLANKIIYSGSFYQKSVHPNQRVNTGSIFFNDYPTSASISFEAFEETYYTPSPSLGGSSLYTNKVRIESSSIDVNKRLNTKTRVERSSFDKFSIDSNRLGVYFSPQTAINEDIFNQLGYFEIDDYIGDPSDIYNDSYKALNTFAIAYWKKYENRNDFEAYFRALKIYDFTLFKYIKQLLPHRVNPILGLVVEPNVLERSKVKTLNKPIIEDLTLDVLFPKTDLYEVLGEYTVNEGIIENVSPYIESEISSIPRADIENVIDIDRLGTDWVQNRYIGKYKITESGSYIPVTEAIINARPSQFGLEEVYFYSNSESASLGLPVSSSFVPAQVTDYTLTAYSNPRYNGSKLTGAGININSEETIDGGPVVQVLVTNSNQIVAQQNSGTGNLLIQ